MLSLLRKDIYPRVATHVKSQHQNVKYPCGLCPYQATVKGHLSRHKKTVHHADTSAKLNCDFCDFKTVHKSYLTQHTQLLHSGNAKVFECNICPYHTVYKQSLVAHKRSHINANKLLSNKQQLKKLEPFKFLTCKYCKC